MKTILTAASILLCASSVAQDFPTDLQGLWLIDRQPDNAMPADCSTMSLEFTDDGRIIRTTGALEYTTTVTLTPVQKGWKLSEQLEGNNGLVSCNGNPADLVVKHLERPAYVELQGDKLLYSKSSYGVGPSMTFSRVSN